MSIDVARALSGGVSSIGAGGDPAARAKAKADASQQERDALVDEIRQKGFVSYVKDLEKQKMEEMRKKILEGMGLTEEDLAKMSPQQRAAVEKAVAQEMQRRLEASHLANNDSASDSQGTSASGSDLSKTDTRGDDPAKGPLQPGFARFDTTLLQALQEVRDEQAANESGQQAKKDPLFG